MADDLVRRSTLEQGIVELAINRPERRNALSTAVLHRLTAELRETGADPGVRVIVVTGVGDAAFCAGGDLSSGGNMGASLAEHEGRRAFVDLFRTMRRLGRPSIARVQGHCLGGGLGLMLACDLAIAARRATFGTPEIRVGLFPMMVMALLFRTIGRRQGLEMILTGERVDADEAARIGLVNRVVTDGDLDAAVLHLARRLAGLSPAVLRLGRNAFYTQEDMPFDQALEFLHGQLTINTLTDDAAEGVAAFLARRDPQWTGR